MNDEKYFVQIGETGSEGLGTLDYCFNKTTQTFLLEAGLKSGMHVLDIGCGSGAMTTWIAQQVGESGRVVAIENDHNQLNAAKKRTAEHSIKNIEFKLCSAYEIDNLQDTFDLVYCRFVLHHLQKPSEVIQKIYQILKPNGIYAAEEGIVNFAFSYPFSPAWGEECLGDAPWTDREGSDRDGNLGIKMLKKMSSVGFTILSTQVIHPLLTTRKEKQLLLLGRDELKDYYLQQGHSTEEWDLLTKETENIVNNDEQIVGFYASCQVAGVKV